MSKFLKVRLLCTFIVLVASVGTMFATVVVTIDGTEYSLNSTTLMAEVSIGNFTIPDVVIPESVRYNGTTYSVTSIGTNAFKDLTGLTSINIPNSVTSIGDSAFYMCDNLTSITIPNSVTSIGYDAFYGCVSLPVINNLRYADTYLTEAVVNTLPSYTIQPGTRWIGLGAFFGCSNLISITIPNSVIYIEDFAFLDCSRLKSVAIPNSVVSIGYDAFYGCSSLTSVTLPNSITSINGGTFYACRNLTSITIPNSVTSIEYEAFYGCGSLTSVTIPNSVTSIGNSAFYSCSGLTSITIPSSVTSIGESAFSGCTSLTSVEISDGITSIGRSAFRNCTELTSITIPSSVTSMGDYAFCSSNNLASITCEAIIPPTLGNGVFMNADKTIPLYVPYGTLDAYSEAEGWRDFSNIQVIPCTIASGTCGNDLTWELSCYGTLTISGTGYMNNFTAGSYAPWYSHSYNIFTIIMEAGVKSIGELAFYNCSRLTSISIPNSVTSIGNNAFYNCSGLTSVIIPNSVTSIGDYAFYGCSGLTSVIIPNSVTSIGRYAFSECRDLTSITISNRVTSIKEYTFSYCHQLTSVTIPANVTNIGNNAFSSCSSLTSVIIPNRVTTIESSAFSYCSNLTSVTIPSSVTSIESGAFSYCNNLTSVTLNSNAIVSRTLSTNPLLINIFGSQVTEYIIGDSVTNIGNNAFSGCSSLTSVTIPNNVTSIGSSAFSNCSSLTSLTIPRGVTSIESSVFNGCNSLTSVTVNSDSIINKNYTSSSSLRNIFGSQVTKYIIGAGVTGIGDYAFYLSTNLTSIEIPNSVTSIGNYAFQCCYSLASIEIPNSVTSLGEGSFSTCSMLESINIPNSVTSIGKYAFANCSNLITLTLPNSVTSIGELSFAGCSGLDSVICYAITPPILGEYVFSGVNCSQVPLYVPNESAAQYCETDQWKEFYIRLLNPYNCIVNATATNGIVEGTGEYEAYSRISLKVIPENGYIFKQWSDGNTDNPRMILVSQDSILTAICEEFQEPENTAHLPYNEPFTSNIGGFSILDVDRGGLNYVWTWASANYGMKASAYVNKTNYTTESWLISPPISLMNASNIVLSFQHAVNKGAPDNLSVKISTDLGTTWSNLSVSNWPAGTNWDFVSVSESLDAYSNNIIQIAFVYVSTSSNCPTWEVKNFSISSSVSEEEPMPIMVDANETIATVTWLEVPYAATYELIIRDSNWNVICVMLFDSEGNLLDVANYAPNRNRSSQQEQTNELAYTITELNRGTEYHFMLVAKDDIDNMITSYSGSFKTKGNPTALEETEDNISQNIPEQGSKLIHNGHLFILREGKIFNAQGARVK